MGDLARDPLPLRDRTALVTGVSRRAGIGYAISRRLLGYGARVAVHHHRAHDEAQPWGADPGGTDAVLDDLRGTGALAGDVDADLADPTAPARVIQHAVDVLGRLDVLVCNHARSEPDGALGELDAAILDGHWAVDARASILLAQEHAAQHDGRDGGRIVFLTSGQELGPMPGEVAYAAAKGALAAITLTLADQLADAGITVNTVDPGPVDTATPRRRSSRRRRRCSRVDAGALPTTRRGWSHGWSPTRRAGSPDR